MTVRIVLADDHELFLAGLRSVLEQEADIEIVAEANDGSEAIEAVSKHLPEVVVMDVEMPVMNGIEAVHRIRRQFPDISVLVLSMHRDHQHVTAVLDAGASGYITKESALSELIDAIHNVVEGRTYLSPSIARTVVDAYRSGRRADELTPFGLLTDREREVLQLIAEGHSTRRIADRLHVSTKTVSTHREHLMKKLEVHSVAELTRYAIKEGLTSIDL